MRLLEIMLKDFDEGRSRSFYCMATTLLSIGSLAAALDSTEKKIKGDKAGADDIKTRAKILRGCLENFAAQEGIELKLRKKVGARRETTS